MRKAVFVFTALFAALAQAAPASCLITQNSIGGIRIGQTLAEVRRFHPKIKIEQVPDADAGEVTLLTLTPKIEIAAYLSDEKRGKIQFLETFSPACRTKDGVHPKMRPTQTAKQWGRLKNITMSEIEMRQFAEFAKQPEWLNLRVEGGDFGNPDADEFQLPMTTKKYARDAEVLNIGIGK